MSLKHEAAAWDLPLPSLTKLVLLRLGWHACEYCGLAWPSVDTLRGKTGLGATRVREDLDALERAGYIKTHAYATGGRGKSTQYIVLPGIIAAVLVPCGKCQFYLANPPRREGFAKTSGAKPTATRGVYAKPTARTGKTHRGGAPSAIAEVLPVLGFPSQTAPGPGGQLSVNTEQSAGADAPEAVAPTARDDVGRAGPNTPQQPPPAGAAPAPDQPRATTTRRPWFRGR